MDGRTDRIAVAKPQFQFCTVLFSDQHQNPRVQTSNDDAWPPGALLLTAECLLDANSMGGLAGEEALLTQWRRDLGAH